VVVDVLVLVGREGVDVGAGLLDTWRTGAGADAVVWIGAGLAAGAGGAAATWRGAAFAWR
jgi:hypothetical protein